MNSKIDKNRLKQHNDTILLIVDKNKKALNKSEIKEDRIPSIKLSIVGDYVGITKNLYSLGAEKSELKKHLLELFKVLPNYWIQEKVKFHMGKGKRKKVLDQYFLGPYIDMRWILSLAILLDIADEEFGIISKLIKRDNVKDTLYDFLINSKDKNWSISKEMNIKKPKNEIVEIIFEQDKKRCEKKVKTYLEKQWYKTYKNASWYNSHIHFPNTFYGYWAFEAAALVKIKGLDDSSFRDNDFYPDRLM